MKRINFNIKDRKTLSIMLCLVLVCVFTLTTAYAALNAVLTIQGNAQVSSADWDVHLANPVVKNGSVTTTVPTLTSGKTLTFSTTLNMPGDFYEFTVDVVNSGSIDAMIEKVTKTPDLTTEQAKYLSYEVSYANGESISTKQNIISGVTMPIKVRVEYRKDLVASDLPTGQIQLTLGLILDYVQSDGTGTTVKDNGKVATANGSLDAIGTIVTIGSEQFYTIGTEGNNVKLFPMMNIELSETPLQNEQKNITEFSTESEKGEQFSDYNGSIVEKYVNNYKSVLESNFGIEVIEARLITYDELSNPNSFACSMENGNCFDSPYTWIYSTAYWTDYVFTHDSRLAILEEGYFSLSSCYMPDAGIRPVIIISKDNF